MLYPQKLRALAQVMSRSCRAGVDLNANEAADSLDAVVEAETRPANAPAAERNMRRQR
jgi:hypothetical protein